MVEEVRDTRAYLKDTIEGIHEEIAKNKQETDQKLESILQLLK